MVDYNDIKANPEKYIHACETKNVAVDINRLIELGEERKKLRIGLELVRGRMNAIATDIKLAGKPTPEQINEGREMRDKAKDLEKNLEPVHAEFSELLYKVPNPPSEDTPIGKDDSENVVLRQWGEIPKFEFTPKEHWQLGEELDVIDTERASKVSGSRFAYLKGDLVRLQFALIDLVIEKLSDEKFIAEVIAERKLDLPAKPYRLVVPPVIINPEPFQRMARLEPREERYHITADDQYLIGSAEHTLGAMYMDETLQEEELPIRYLGYSTSFRREAGSYGKDTKGILRLHQFDKLEMEAFSVAETSLAEQELMVGIQEKLLQELKLPYQVMICCTGDQGDPDARHLDINTWMPGQNKYRETHSADLMTDYQARRLNTRVKRATGETELVHMNDATAFAIGRTLIAIMENYQQADGSITVPEALRKYASIDQIRK